MKLLDIVNSPWAIQPAKLEEIREIYATHLRGDKIDIAAVESRLGRPLANEPKAYEIIDGVAVLPIDGVMAKRANLFMQVSGGTSTQLVARDLRQAIDDPSVHSIVLHIDSPGGTVDGTQALADAVAAATALKPVVTLAHGTMASAAYWVGSAAKASYIADATTVVGSIGVVATHMDVSKAEEARGVKTTEIVAGKFKRVASQYGALTEAGRATMQEQVDYTYSIFVGAVAKQRGVSEDKVLQDMADGRVFMGQQAVDAGLVDGVITLDQLVEQLNAERAGAARPGMSRAGAAQSNQPQGNNMSLTKEQVAAEHPAVAEALRAEGAAAERARIQAVEAQSLPGHEQLISTLKFDGKSTAGDAAMAVLAADKSSRADQAKRLAADAPEPLPAGAKASVDKPQASTPAQAAAVPQGYSAINADSAKTDADAKAFMAANPGTTYVAAVKAVQQKGA